MSWLIVGGGVSGLGAAKLLSSRGHTVRLSEGQNLSRDRASAWTQLGVEICDGGHSVAHLDGIKHVVLSPGVPPNLPLVIEAKRRGLDVCSEIDLALAEFNGKLAVVTGTNGKSTVCAMLFHILKKAGYPCALGGNFGDPPTAMLAEGRLAPLLVLELSSYQLESSGYLSPKVAIFTSFSHDHMARHGSLASYFEAKWRITHNMRDGDLLLAPRSVIDYARSHGLHHQCKTVIYDDTGSGSELPQRSLLFSLHEKTFGFGKLTVDLGSLLLQEPHNLLNAAFAMLAAEHLAGIELRAGLGYLQDFHGLPHRCEIVGRIFDEPIINDSKSTNVESTLMALKSVARPVILMLGGQGKGEPYSPLLEQKHRIRAAVCFGASGALIASQIASAIPTHQYASLALALQELREICHNYRSGILFSPACASFDEFRNFEHRGETFRLWAENVLLSQTSPRP